MRKRKRKRWAVVFGPPGRETKFVAHPRNPRVPGWSYSKEEAKRLCSPGGRVVDADKFWSRHRLELASQMRNRVDASMYLDGVSTADLP